MHFETCSVSCIRKRGKFMNKRRLSKQGKRLIASIVVLILLILGTSIYFYIKSLNVETTYGKIHTDVDVTKTIASEDEKPEIEKLTFKVIDVGQGQSIFIDYGETEVLIDAGSYSDGSQKVCETIKDYVDGPIEYVIGTHSHEDHIGGMAQVYDNFDVETTIYGDLEDNKWCDVFKEKATASGKFINDEDTTIELGPETTLTIFDIVDDAENTNNNSVICLLKHRDVTFFMSGDLEKEYEVSLRKDIGTTDVVVLSHHGSDTSNSNLDLLQPKIILASCSKDNEYGHISKSVLEQALTYGDVYATFKSGTMTLTSDGSELTFDMKEKDKLKKTDYGKGDKK